MTKKVSLNINEGTITFTTKENSLFFCDNALTTLASANPQGGSILMLKDSDNKIKVLFAVLGKGRVDLEYDVSNLSSDKKHMFAFSWSLNDKKMVLYIDGEKVAEKEIVFKNV